MKNNTQEAKSLLLKALSHTPNDNALSEVRHYIRIAMSKLEHLEKKRERREVVAEKRESKAVNYGYDPLRMIQAIDEEIFKEKNRLNEIQRRRNLPKEEEKGDEDEFSTVFG
jgi:hypothetical protein